ncbi:MAG: arylsulfatase [bacterium]|nr:arylsulfatase [bacterium]
MLQRIALLLPLVAAPVHGSTFFQGPAYERTPPPADYGLDPFYVKHVSVGGFPIIGSERAPDAALFEAAFLIEHMLAGRDDVREALIAGKVRFAVMAHDELTTQVPEHSDLEPKKYWDRRARGLGATPHRPAVSCGAENLLGYPGDPYAAENILIHEFAHAMHEMGLAVVDEEFDGRLQAAYHAAMEAGRYKDKYASTNHKEYWAEGVQSYFDTNRENDREHNHVNTREELEAYDPALFALLEEAFPRGDWRYARPTERLANPHLGDWDPGAGLPMFRWPDELEAWYRENGGAIRQKREGRGRAPNVVYILADDLGWSEVGSYGQTKIATPNLDRLAREGMRFTQHYSGSPVCAPSRCVLLTGKHTGHATVRDNWENGGWGRDEPEGQYPLPTGTPTLGSVLQEAGYATPAVGKWGLGGPDSTGHPNQQGFEHFYGYLCQRKAHNYYPTHLWRNEAKHVLEGNAYFRAHQKLGEPLATEAAYFDRFQAQQYAPDLMIEEALGFVKQNAKKPFFLYFASPVPHVALQVPAEELEQYPREWDAEHYLGQKSYLPHPRPRAAYAAMVTRFDRDIGRILNLLDELELTDNTLVLFSSDNGPTFNGGTDSEFFESAGPFRGLKCSVYEGGIRVPMIARWPERIAAGAETNHLSAFQDVLPTVAELVGAKTPEGLDGVSFAPTLLGDEGQAQHDYLYWEYAGQQALRAGQWKAVRPKLERGDVTTQLFDLESDVGEKNDVADEHPEVLARMEKLLLEARSPSKVFPLPAIDVPAKR